MMARVVTPLLRARQAWCLGSRSLPDVSLFHGAAAHYAQTAVGPAAFPRQNAPLLAACEGLRRLHLNPEMISDRRLEQGDIRSRLLLLEDTLVLTENNRQALRRYVERGGRLLLTGRAVAAAQLTDADAAVGPGLTRQALGKGEALCLLQPLFLANAIVDGQLPPENREGDRQFHAGCGEHIEYHKCCPKHGRVPADQIAKGYPYSAE